MDLNAVIDKAKLRLNLRSDREYSARLKKAHNYIALLRESPRVSAGMLAQIYEDAGEDPTKPVLAFLRDREEGSARKIIDKAIKALSAACIVTGIALASSTITPSPASANCLTEGGAPYTLCDN